MILTVQPARKKSDGIFRLGFGHEDSKQYFKRGQTIELVLAPDIRIPVNIACGPPKKKGFDINSKILCNWIKKRGFDKNQG